MSFLNSQSSLKKKNKKKKPTFLLFLSSFLKFSSVILKASLPVCLGAFQDLH